VIAIFDMGSHQPVAAFRRQRPGNQDGTGEILECNAYSALEFDARAEAS
jgi:hypothetical protein